VSFLALLRKELRWSKHNVVALLILLLVLPGIFAYTSVAFQSVIPQDAPVAVVAEDDSVTEDELVVVDGAASLFANPVRYDSEERAMRALQRESVYAVVTVPPGLLNESRETNLTLTVEGAMVLFDEPSQAMVGILNTQLDRSVPGSVTVDRVVVGDTHSLAEYLIPILFLGVMLLFAFTYVPYNLAGESRAIQRIRTESSLESLAASKLAFFTAAMLVPIGVFGLLIWYLDYAIPAATVGVTLVLLLTFVSAAAVAMSIMLLTRFDVTGRFVAVAVLFGLLAFGGIIYPAGFFSPIRRSLVRAMPVHYAAIVLRGELLRDVPLSTYADYLAILAGTAVASLGALKLSIVAFRRGE
jgi:ABC-2 type transport system permease protein